MGKSLNWLRIVGCVSDSVSNPFLGNERGRGIRDIRGPARNQVYVTYNFATQEPTLIVIISGEFFAQ
jgi:hypothetical protein